MISRLFFSMLFAFAIPLLVNGQDSLSLDACLKRAFEQNASVLVAAKQAELAKNSTQASRFNYLPTVEANARRSYNWGLFIDPATNVLSNFSSQVYSGSLYATAELFNGGRYFYLTQQQKALEDVARWNTEEVKFNLGLGIVDNYFKARLASEKLVVARMGVARAEVLLLHVQKMIAAGTRTKPDQLAAESNLLQAQNAVMQYEKEIELNVLALKYAIGQGLPALNEPLFSAEAISGKPARLALAATLPAVKVLEAQKLYFQHSMKLARALNYPVFTMQAGATTRSSSLVQLEVGNQFSNNLSRTFSFNLQVPVFNKFQNRFASQTARLNWELSEARISETRNKTDKTNALLQAEIRAAVTNCVFREKQLQLSFQEYEATTRLFQIGTCTLQNLLDSFTRLKEAESNARQAIVELNYFDRLSSYYSQFAAY